jgi:hypothetical protein
MTDIEWDGQPARISHLALALGTSTEPDQGPSLGVAAESGERYEIKSGRIGEFLRIHWNAVLVCHDAANLHWTIADHLQRVGDMVAWAKLWGFSRSSRIHDLRLFDQLYELGRLGTSAPPRGLADLAREWTDGGYVAPDEVAGSGLPLAVRDALLILAIYERQKPHTMEFSELVGVPLAAVLEFGPMGLGVLVQGAIALGRAARNGIRVRGDAIPELERRCHESYRDASRLLHRSTDARRCFGWDRTEIRRDRRGFPVLHEDRLRKWLERVVAATPGPHGIPLEPPRSPKGKISTVPDYWGDLALVHAEVRAWATLWAAASTEMALKKIDGEGRIYPRYVVASRLASMHPNLAELRRLGRSPVFEARPGRVLLVGRLPDLAIRCQAQIVANLDEQSVVGLFLRIGEDPVRVAVNHLRALAPAPAGMSQPFGEDDATWTAIAQALLMALSRGLGATHVRALLALDPGITISAADAERYTRIFIDTVLPELGLMTEDRTFEKVAGKLMCSPEGLGALKLGPDPRTAPAALRNLLSGETKNPRAFTALRDLCSNDDLVPLLEAGEGSPELYDAVFLELTTSAVGRIRRERVFSEAQTARHLDRADEVMMMVLYRLVAAGYELVAQAGEEFVLEVAKDHVEGALERVKVIAEEAVGELLASTLVECEVGVVEVW